MVAVSIRLVRHFSADYEMKLHMLRYLQQTVQMEDGGNWTLDSQLCQLVDVIVDVNGSALLTVWEHGEPVGQQSPIALDPVADLNLRIGLLHLLHSFGVAGGISLADNRSAEGKFHDFIDPLADNDSHNELTDISAIATFINNKYSLLTSTSAELTGILRDMASEEFTVFELFQRHPDLLKMPSSSSSQIHSRKHKIHYEYAKWKANGKNALLEYQRENKYAYYPITQIPLVSVNNTVLFMHSSAVTGIKSSNAPWKPATDLKDVIVNLNPDELIDAPISATEQLQHDRSLRWLTCFVNNTDDNFDINQALRFMKYKFDKTEKYQVDVNLDRQLEVDLPRCHSYHPQINSPAGQYKLKRLIKAFLKLEGNENLVYWQGLDSIAAIFLTVFYYEDHVALHCLNEFVHRYLACFFVENNAPAVEVYLETFQNLIGYFDPELAMHLAKIEFWPDLYAVPWFLTMFSHTLSLHNLLQLWDAIFSVPQNDLVVKITRNHKVMNSQVIAIFVAVAIMQANRSILHQSDFHDCIHVFSELNFQQDISVVVENAAELLRKTPHSILYKLDDVLHSEKDKQLLSADPETRRRSSIFGNGRMRIATIDAIDISFQLKSLGNVTSLDIRSSEVWTETGHLKGSLCIPCVSAMDDSMLEQKMQFLKTLPASGDSIIIIGNSQENELELRIAQQLLRKHAKGVVILRGGMDALQSSNSSFPADTKLELCDCAGVVRNAIRQCK